MAAGLGDEGKVEGGGEKGMEAHLENERGAEGKKGQKKDLPLSLDTF